MITIGVILGCGVALAVVYAIIWTFLVMASKDPLERSADHLDDTAREACE